MSTALRTSVTPIDDSITSLYGFTRIDAVWHFDAVKTIDAVRTIDDVQPIDDDRLVDAVKDLPAELIVDHAKKFGLTDDEAGSHVAELVRFLVLRAEHPDGQFAAAGIVSELLFAFWARAWDYAMWHYSLFGDLSYGGVLPEYDRNWWETDDAYRAFYAAYTNRFGSQPPEVWPSPDDVCSRDNTRAGR